jgi:hypothetical protein
MQETAFSRIRRKETFRLLNPLEELLPSYSCHQAPDET